MNEIEQKLKESCDHRGHKNSLPGTIKVNSLNGCVVGVLYETLNYDLFVPRPENRGGKIKTKKKLYLIEQIKKGRFFFDMYTVLIDEDGILGDGYHKVLALKETKNPVVFRVTSEHSIEDVAHFNDNKTPSNWTPKEIFTTAIMKQYPMALEFEKISKNLRDMGITKNSIVPSNFLSLLSRDIKIYNKKIALDVYKDEKLSKRLKSKDFVDNIKFYGYLKSKYSILTRGYTFIECVFEAVLREKKFDYKGFTELLNNYNWSKFQYTRKGDYRRVVNELVTKLEKTHHNG